MVEEEQLVEGNVRMAGPGGGGVRLAANGVSEVVW